MTTVIPCRLHAVVSHLNSSYHRCFSSNCSFLASSYCIIASQAAVALPSGLRMTKWASCGIAENFFKRRFVLYSNDHKVIDNGTANR